MLVVIVNTCEHTFGCVGVQVCVCRYDIGLLLHVHVQCEFQAGEICTMCVRMFALPP